MVRVFTDGSCYPNPGKIGGWAYIIKDAAGNVVIKHAGVERGDVITNNRMELMAAIQGLSVLDEPSAVELVTDSEYLGKGIQDWMYKWEKTGFRQKNGDLWRIIYDLCSRHSVYITFVKGHSGHPENEECDRMAGEIVKLDGLS